MDMVYCRDEYGPAAALQVFGNRGGKGDGPRHGGMGGDGDAFWDGGGVGH